MYQVLRQSNAIFMGLAPELVFGDMRQNVGLQSADLFAYEMTKELRNQDLRPENRVRWPLDQILAQPDSPRGKMLKYNTTRDPRSSNEPRVACTRQSRSQGHH